MYYKTREQAEEAIAEAKTSRETYFSYIQGYVYNHKLVVLGPDSDDEYQVVEEKVCGDCGQTWHSRALHEGRPTESCPACTIAAQDKLAAEAPQARRQAELDRQRSDTFDRYCN